MNRSGSREKKQHRFGWHNLIFIYIILLTASQVVRCNQPAPMNGSDDRRVARISLPTEKNGQHPDIPLYFDEYRPKSPPQRAPVLVIDGLSAVSESVSGELVAALAKSGQIIIPDLRSIVIHPSIHLAASAAGQASILLALMDHLGIDAVHLVAFGTGGPVAVRMAERKAESVKSVSMISAVGVQEFELLGSYHINRALYAGQLAVLWVIQNAIPHMGLLDGLSESTALARIRFETDLRPIRRSLLSFQPPLLIATEAPDNLVPAAARELHRIVPQSELIRYRTQNRIQPADSQHLAERIDRFIGKVEQNRSTQRSTAAADRVAAAARPFSSIPTEPMRGRSLVLVVLLLAAATLISEDLTCIAAGLLVARGAIGIVPAVGASFSGILLGDILLFLAGRFFGRPALKVPPFKWLVGEADIQRTSAWFSARGPAIIISSRFMPGLRLPTYFAAGVLRTRFSQFLLYFIAAVAMWTPLLVGLATVVGTRMFAYYDLFGRYAIGFGLATVALLWAATRIIAPLFSYRGRRLLLSWFRRLTRWEFWPPAVFYLPVIGYFCYLAVRFRSLTVFTACNPGIPEGGFREESKSQILDHLKHCATFVARYRLIRCNASASARIRQAADFMRRFDLRYPVVLKPDIGQRGEGVAIVRSEQQLGQHLRESDTNWILQEHIEGREFGVFYYRYPDQEAGRIFSITDKRLLQLTGDGRSSLEQLILQDDRAVCMAPFHLRRHQENLFSVPEKGERFKLVEVGTHCRGALFLDGSAVWTPQLEAAIDRLSKQFEGFYFGRYDVVTPCVEDFRNGENFKIIELNGVTSEATHIYQPGTSLWRAYAVLMHQWRLAFEIGAINARRGCKPAPLGKLAALIIRMVTGRRPPPAEASESAGGCSPAGD